MLFSDESAIGISSTPGTQTMTNCPGENANGLSNTNVRIEGVSRLTRAIVTGNGKHSHPWAHPTISAAAIPSFS